DHAGQKADQRDDREGFRARFLDEEPQIPGAVAGAEGEEAAVREHELAEEGEGSARLLDRLDRRDADVFEQRAVDILSPRILALRRRLREVEQAVDAGGEARRIDLDVPRARKLDDFAEKREQAAIPRLEAACVEGDPANSA